MYHVYVDDDYCGTHYIVPKAENEDEALELVRDRHYISQYDDLDEMKSMVHTEVEYVLPDDVIRL